MAQEFSDLFICQRIEFKLSKVEGNRTAKVFLSFPIFGGKEGLLLLLKEEFEV